MLGKHVLELVVVALRQMRVRANEERRPIIFNPCRKFVELAIDAVEQNYAAHAIFGEATNRQAVGGGQKAAAVADNDDWHVREGLGGERIAVPPRIEILGDVQQNPAVVIGAASAVVRKRCGVEFNQFGQWFLDRQTLRSDLLRMQSILKPILIER